MEKKRIAILGSTGSIGIQALDIIRNNPGLFCAEVLTAGNNVELLLRQAREFHPNMVVVANETHYSWLRDALEGTNIKVFAGNDSISQIVGSEVVDTVLNAIVGFAGFEPTIRALEAGKDLALANKESIVAGGQLVTSLVARHHNNLIPVDSEHSAIFQCLIGEQAETVEKIFLTASGGPFRGKDLKFLEKVSPQQALRHPNWEMGEKITIDSASLMNKGLEVIEARWLFGLEPHQIEVIIHPQSVIHSMVQFHDGSVKAQLGHPDMRIPIIFALSYPERLPSEYRRFNIADYPELTFEAPDMKIFRNLALAYEALRAGGNIPCAMNAANEMAVEAFLKRKISFLQIPAVVEKCMENTGCIDHPSFADYCETDREVRVLAKKYITEESWT
jgi:1-deoxy-D-xylulose-5-phosphate reductoisomerase